MASPSPGRVGKKIARLTRHGKECIGRRRNAPSDREQRREANPREANGTAGHAIDKQNSGQRNGIGQYRR